MNEVKEQRNGPILEVHNLKKYFQFMAFSDDMADVKLLMTCLSVQEETLGLVGESGCGKQHLEGQFCVSMNPQMVRYSSRRWTMRDITKAPQKELKGLPAVQIFSSLSPRMTVQDIITEV